MTASADGGAGAVSSPVGADGPRGVGAEGVGVGVGAGVSSVVLVFCCKEKYITIPKTNRMPTITFGSITIMNKEK